MSALQRFAKFLGFDPAREKYRYGVDPRFGYTAAEKIPERWVKTTCGYCSVGCGMFVGVRDGKAVATRGDPDHPVNRGTLCPKGLTEHHTLAAPGRALRPLLRIGEELKPVDWETAYETLVGRFLAIQRRYGNGAMGVLSTGQLVTEEFYALGKLVQLGFGTNNYDGNTTLCMASAVSGYKLSFGSDGPPGAYEDFELSDCVFLLGANPADNHPVLWDHLRRSKKRLLIVADPRVTKTTVQADIHLPLKPRSDLTLLNGIAKILIDEGRVERASVEARASGFDALKKHLEKFPLERVSAETGLSKELILRAARAYGGAKAALLAWTMGVNHSTHGTLTVAAINNLALLTGNLGRPGASALSITGQCNAMGTRETGFTTGFPGYRKYDSEADRAEIASLWGVPEETLPKARGMAYPDLIEGIIREKIKGLWIIGTNPLVSYPNQELLKDALSRLEFLVVQDGYHPTPTTELASLVLPAAIWGEKEGTFTNSERRVSKVNKAVDPPGEARSDFQIFLDVAERLGAREKLYPGWKSPRDAFEEWKKISKGRLCDYSSFTYEEIEEKGGLQWGGPRLYGDGKFKTPDGKAVLVPADPAPAPEEVSPQFPFTLNTGRTVEHWHTRTKTGRVPLLEKMAPEAWAEINSRDARKLGIRPGTPVRIRSRRGEISRITARPTETVPPGQVFIPFHYIEACANNLTVDAFDPISREPNYKQCAVQVERL
ncbi:MAG: nitrate reductase [Bdellovibrionota bacterium]